MDQEGTALAALANANRPIVASEYLNAWCFLINLLIPMESTTCNEPVSPDNAVDQFDYMQVFCTVITENIAVFQLN